MPEVRVRNTASAMFAVAFVMVATLPGCATHRLADRTTNIVQFSGTDAEVVAELEMPPGHITVSPDGRVFLDANHYVRNAPAKIVELVSGQLVAFPAVEAQKPLDTTHALRVDQSNRLWVLDYGNYRLFGSPKLLAFDLTTGKLVHEYHFTNCEAGCGSMLNDLVVDDDNNRIYISDSSPLAGNPAIVVYDIGRRHARRVLEDHASVVAAKYSMVVHDKPWKVLGLIQPKIGIDGIALDRANGWLYYAGSNTGELYRISVDDLNDVWLTDHQLGAKVEKVADITMTDGMTVDKQGNVYLTDFEHSAIVRVKPDGRLETLLKDRKYRWPTAFSFGPDGWLYFTCNAIDEVTMKSGSKIHESGPYGVYRFKPGVEGVPGH
jgi:sugar lactone lactonase YvrE